MQEQLRRAQRAGALAVEGGTIGQLGLCHGGYVE